MGFVFRKCMMVLLLLGLCLAIGNPAQAMRQKDDITVLTFGIIPTDSLSQLKKWFEPFAQELSRKMGPGYEIETKYASDYAGIIEGMRFDKVDFALFGNKSALEASKRADGEVFAQVANADGTPGYWSHIIVHKDSPYNSIDGIIDNAGELVFGNGDPNSTSGYLVPSYYIWGKRGLTPEKIFKEVRHASHEANCMAVARKQVDFATNNNGAIERFKESNPELGKKLKVIWKSPLIPNDPMVWREDLPREVKSALKAAMLGFGRTGPKATEEKELLYTMQEGFAPFYNSDNRQLLPIRQLNLAKNKMQIQANQDLSSSAKTNRIQKIEAELKALQRYDRMVDKY